MTYTIELQKRVNENTSQFIFVNSFEDADKWDKSIDLFMEALTKSGCRPLVRFFEDSKIKRVYITY